MIFWRSRGDTRSFFEQYFDLAENRSGQESGREAAAAESKINRFKEARV